MKNASLKWLIGMIILENSKVIFFKKYIVFLIFITWISYILLRIFYPSSYSVLNMMLGPAGSFDDTLNQIKLAVTYFDKSSSYISVPNLVWLYQMINGLNHSLILAIFLIFSVIPIVLIAFLTKTFEYLLLIGIHPILFSIFRGSFDHILALYLSIAFIFILNKPAHISYAIFLASTFIKPSTAVVFAIPYLKNYKSTWIYFYSIIFIIFTTLSLGLVGNGLIDNIQVFKESLKQHSIAYYYGDGGLLFNNSFFSLQKLVIYNFCYSEECIKYFIEISLDSLSIFAALSTIGLVVLFLLNKTNVKVTLVWSSLVCVFLLPVSPDYRLSLLIIPIIYIITDHFNLSYFEKRFFYLVFILFLPKSFYIFKVGPHMNDLTVSAILNPLCVLIFIVVEIVIFLRSLVKARLG